jgi:hypothetical protein
VFLVSIGLLTLAPSFLLGQAIGDYRIGVAPFVAGTALQVILVSFTALATALLYYDLRARREALASKTGAAERPARPIAPPPPTDHGIDPRLYSDENRPNGWYVDPESPSHMRYWDASEPSGWQGKTRTPHKLQRQWRDQSD